MKSRPLNLVLVTLLFPFTILVVVPLILMGTFGIEIPSSDYWGFWVSKTFIPFGWSVAGFCVTLFYIDGKGTPAPWMPPTKLMVTGPYRYVRNPMTTGVLMVLAGEAMLVASPTIGAWLGFLFVSYSLYYIFIEEPTLEKRFGEDYLLYKANVGRWIPRYPGWTAPWLPIEDEESESTKRNDEIKIGIKDRTEQ